MREEKVLSTDRQKASSAQRLKFALALCTILAFTVTWTAVSPASSQAKSEESVGQRLVADLTWPQPVRDRRFAHMDTVFPVHTVRRGATVLQLPAGAPLLPDVVASYMQSEHLAGVLVLQAGRVRAERYALGLTPADRWTGFSMTKAMTDTLAGAAVRAGAIHSLDDDVTRYLPEMRGSAYDGVTVRQLMTMTSGVRWNENYTTADADNVRLYTMPVAAGRNATMEYMRTLHRDAAPGSRWLYNTGETDLLGVLLRRAMGRTLAQQLSAALWKHAGMEHDATWIANDVGPRGEEFGGSGLSATLRDWGRLGLWVMRGGGDTVPAGWFAEATKAQVHAGAAGYGYGWWPQGTDGSYAALGIFGQSIFVDPSRQLVIVTVGDWPQASGAAHTAARTEFWQQVKAAVDKEEK